MVATEENCKKEEPIDSEPLVQMELDPERGLLAKAEKEFHEIFKEERRKQHLVDSLAAIDPELAYQVALKESKRGQDSYLPTGLEFASDLHTGDFFENSLIGLDGKELGESEDALSLSEARLLKPSLDYHPEQPEVLTVMRWEPQQLEELLPLMDWDSFLADWKAVKGDSEPLSEIVDFAKNSFSKWCEEWRDLNGLSPRPCGVFAFFPAGSTSDDSLLIFSNLHHQKEPLLNLPLFRQNQKDADGYCWSFSDFIAPMKEEFAWERKGAIDWIGFFAVTAGEELEQMIRLYESQQDHDRLLLTTLLGKQLAKAAALLLYDSVRREYWGYDKKLLSTQELLAEKGQAKIFFPGSSTLPDRALLKPIFDLISVKARTGIALLPDYQMKPDCSLCGLFVSHPQSFPLKINALSHEQIEEYALKLDEDFALVRQRLTPYC